MNVEKAKEIIRGRSILSPRTGCWNWYSSWGRYGVVKFEGKTWIAHRLSFIAYKGEVPKYTHHECRNRLCVNPNHLMNVTPYEHNMHHLKPYCKNGHPLVGWNRMGYRRNRCRQCQYDAQKRHRGGMQ